MAGAKPDITGDLLRELLDYDQETGAFVWKKRKESTSDYHGCVKRWNDKHVGKVATHSMTNGYSGISIYDKKYYAHRLAWLYVMGKWPENQIDHKDLNKTNNRWSNLRDATGAQNSYNQPLRKDNTTGYKGVYYCRRDDLYTVKLGNEVIGYFKNKDAAINARIKAQAIHGEFVRAA